MRRLSKDEPTESIRLRVLRSTARQIDESAQRKGWKRAAWLREAIRRYLRD